VSYLVVDIRSLDSYSGCEHAEEEGKLHCKGRRIGRVVRRNGESYREQDRYKRLVVPDGKVGQRSYKYRQLTKDD
jgi:hypothetical protein